MEQEYAIPLFKAGAEWRINIRKKFDMFIPVPIPDELK